MKKVAFTTLGCKVNQYDTEAIASLFEKEGFEIVGFGDKADVYVINTCTVTGLSARKSRQMIRRARNANRDSIVVVAGCYAQTAPEEVESIPGVNLIIGTKDRNMIIEYIKQIDSVKGSLNMVTDIKDVSEFEELRLGKYKGRTRAFVKIQEGCSQFCSYCIIPYARGFVRSRKPEDVIAEIGELAEAGFKEVVLTGIHVASYGRDIKNISLMDIVSRVHNIEGIKRIRLGSVEPRTITDEFVHRARHLEKLCPHYHLSLQSGCNQTLKRMNRKYTTSEYKSAVKMLRDNIKDVSITTDIMVGFPGETDEEFEKTYRFVENVAFMKIHVFKYSPREGTPAASFHSQVEDKEKENRSKRLINLSRENNLQFNRNFVGRVMPVLFEQEVESREGFIEGFTPNYIKVLCSGDNKRKGNIVDVKLQRVYEDYIIGEIP